VCAVSLQFNSSFCAGGYTRNTNSLLPQLQTGIPTEWYPSVFHRELQKNYGILPQLPTGIRTEWYLSVFHIELENNYGILPQLPKGIPMHSPTDDAHSKAHVCQTAYRSTQLPTDLPTNAANPMHPWSDAHLPTDVENYGGIFKNFGAKSFIY